MKRCKRCSQNLSICEFYVNRRMRDGHSNFCKRCTYDRHNVARKERQAAARKVVQEIKLAKGCSDCGYKEHPAALDFDHLPGTEKLFNIGTSIATKPLRVVLAEIEKCEVVCANCHRVRTAKRTATRKLLSI